MTIKEFVKKYKPAAEKNEKQSGVPALITLAQAALESGWGNSAPGNNFFGIKAGISWKGETQLLRTQEFDKNANKYVTVRAEFRKYEKPEECFQDHADLLKRRFSKAFKHKDDPVKFIKSVQNDHGYKYATDPNYVDKISEIMRMIDSIDKDSSDPKLKNEK